MPPDPVGPGCPPGLKRSSPARATLLGGGDPAVEAGRRGSGGGCCARAAFSWPPPSAAVAEVDLDTLDHPETRFVGAERLCRHAWDELQLGECLQSPGIQFPGQPHCRGLIDGQDVASGE